MKSKSMTFKTAVGSTLLYFLISGVNTQSITCPTIDCGMDIGTNICFLHSGSNPVTYIRLQQCPSG